MTGPLCAACLQEDAASEVGAVTIAQGTAVCGPHFQLVGLTYEVAQQVSRQAREQQYHAQHPRQPRAT